MRSYLVRLAKSRRRRRRARARWLSEVARVRSRARSISRRRVHRRYAAFRAASSASKRRVVAASRFRFRARGRRSARAARASCAIIARSARSTKDTSPSLSLIAMRSIGVRLFEGVAAARNGGAARRASPPLTGAARSDAGALELRDHCFAKDRVALHDCRLRPASEVRSRGAGKRTPCPVADLGHRLRPFFRVGAARRRRRDLLGCSTWRSGTRARPAACRSVRRLRARTAAGAAAASTWCRTSMVAPRAGTAPTALASP